MGDIITSQKQEWLKRARTAAQVLIDAREVIRPVMQDWNSRSYLSGLIEANYAGTEFEGLTKAQLDDVATSLDAFETWIDTGHDDNLSKITI